MPVLQGEPRPHLGDRDDDISGGGRAKNPGVAQISRQEQVLDILHNVTTTPPDRVKEFSFKGSGGSYAKLFDGTEKVLSWDNIVWLNRSVMQP